MLRRTRWMVYELSGQCAREGERTEEVMETWEMPSLPITEVLPGQYLRVTVEFVVPLPDTLGRKLYVSAAAQGVLGEEPMAWADLPATERESWEGLAEGRWR